MADLRDELLTDPLTRGYSGMTDQEATDDLNTAYRDAPADQGALFNYLAKETAKDHSSEPVATHILGRLRKVDEAGTAGIGAETFVGSETPGPFSNLLAEGLDACRTLLDIALGDRLQSLAQVMTEAKFVTLLDRVKDAGVMKPADVTTIQALSQNKQTRAVELPGVKSPAKVGHVQVARL